MPTFETVIREANDRAATAESQRELAPEVVTPPRKAACSA